MSKRGRGKRAVAAYPRCSERQRPQQQPGGRRNRTSSIASSSGTTTPRASRPSTSVSRCGIPFPVFSGRTVQDSSRSVCAIGPAECDWCVRLSVCPICPAWCARLSANGLSSSLSHVSGVMARLSVTGVSVCRSVPWAKSVLRRSRDWPRGRARSLTS